MLRAADYFQVPLADGSRVVRAYKTERTEGGEVVRRTGFGSWNWLVYDPERRPAKKKVNLRTQDRSAALRLAGDLARKRSLGTFDPWADAAPHAGATLAASAERYLLEKSKTAAPATVDADRGHLDRLARSLPAGTLVRHITTAQVERLVTAERLTRTGTAPVTGETLKRRRASVQHYFAWAVEQGMRPDNPAAPIKLAKSPTRRREHITPDEAVRILARIESREPLRGTSEGAARRGGIGGPQEREWIADWLRFAFGSGLRPGEQQALTWAAVSLAERSVAVGRGHRVKTAGSARVVPVRGDALDVLARRHAAACECGSPPPPDARVFTGAGGAPVNVGYLSKRLQAYARAAGIEKNVTAYSMRHAYGSEMAAQGVPLLALGQMMGTSVRMIEGHYGHHDPTRAANHVERVFGGARA